MAAPDAETVWQYSPSLALAILASILYGFVFLVIFYLTFIKYRSWYFTCVVVGAGVEVVGYGLRCYSIKKSTEVAPFATTLTLIVLAPILISAGNYLLLGRLIRSVLAPVHHHKIIPYLPPHYITRVFVLSDVISGLVQGSGSAIASSDNWAGANLKVGMWVLIGGLALQAGSFAGYMGLLGRFWYLAGEGTGKGRREGERERAPKGWRRLAGVMGVSSAAILIRCIYRVAEFAEGVEGYSFTHEWLFWIFEAVPMLVAISVFCFSHPGSILGRDGGSTTVLSEEDGEELTARRRRYRKR